MVAIAERRPPASRKADQEGSSSNGDAGSSSSPGNVTLVARLLAIDLEISNVAFRTIGPGGFMGEKLGAWVWEAISFLADGFCWFLIVPVYTLAKHRKLDALLLPDSLLLAATLVVDIPIIVGLKQLFKRRRPPAHKHDMRFVGVDKFSFPSGHATRCWALVAALCFVATHGTRGGLPEGLTPDSTSLIVGWGCAVSVSRIALGRHFVSDVLVGAMIGCVATFPIALALTTKVSGGAW